MATRNRRTFLSTAGTALATSVRVRPAEWCERHQPRPSRTTVEIFVDTRHGEDQWSGMSPGSEATQDTVEQSAAAIAYTPLAVPVALEPRGEFYGVSLDRSGCDQWYNSDTIVDTAPVVATSGGVLDLASGPSGLGFAEWQAFGHDLKSVIANQLFIGPEEGDYDLLPGLPSYFLGSTEIDISTGGPR